MRSPLPATHHHFQQISPPAIHTIRSRLAPSAVSAFSWTIERNASGIDGSIQRMSNRIPIRIDQIDRRILRALQRDGRLQNVELAKQVGLSPSPCLRRVRRLEQTGVIDRYVAVIDAAKVGIGLEVFARVRLVTQDAETVERFSRAMRSLPQVVECHIMAGECDALLRVVAADIDDYRNFQSTHLTRNNAVESVKTDIPLQKVKLVSELPI